MADYPSQVQLFRLVGRLGRGMGDTIDTGGDADLAPLVGARIICTPDLKVSDGGPVFKSTASSPPVTIFQETVLGTTNGNGDIVSAMLDIDGKTLVPVDAGQQGISLPFGGSPSIVPTGWTWTVTISVGGNFPDRVFSVYGAAGAAVDVTTLIPVPPNPGTAVADWQAVVQRAENAADRAEDAAEPISFDAASSLYSVAGSAAPIPSVDSDTKLFPPTVLDALGRLYEPSRPLVSTPGPQTGTSQAPYGSTIVGVFGQTWFHWSVFGMARSDNAGGSWAGANLPSDAPTNAGDAGGAWMIQHGGYWYLSARNKSGVPAVWRAAVTPSGGALAWSGSLVIAQAGSLPITTGLATDGSTIFWAEYGDPAAGPQLRLSRDGTTWLAVDFSAYFKRHIHGVFVDPYVQGHIWVTGGDANSNARHVHSTDGGATWSVVPGDLGTNSAWQTVQVSFTADDIFFASDSSSNWDVFKADRATLTPRWHGVQSHRMLPVPAGLPPRQVADLVTVAGSTSVTSASAAFSTSDVGSYIRTFGQDFVPIGSYIAAVNSATSARVSNPALVDGSGITAVLGGETWGAMSYYGAIDPGTGIYYFVTINGAVGGNVDGLFAVLPNGHTVLLDILTTSPDSGMVIAGGRVIIRGFSRPTLSL